MFKISKEQRRQARERVIDKTYVDLKKIILKQIQYQLGQLDEFEEVGELTKEDISQAASGIFEYVDLQETDNEDMKKRLN